MIEKMDAKESAETVLSAMIDMDINNPVIMQDKPINRRKKVENPKNRTSTKSKQTPMITKHSAIEKNLYRSIKNSNFLRAMS